MQDTTGLFDSDVDLANRQTIRPWLSKLGIHPELSGDLQKDILALQPGDERGSLDALNKLETAKAYTAVPEIIKVISYPDPAVSNQAIKVLGSFGVFAADAAPAVVSRAVLYPADKGITAAATTALQQIGSASVAPLYDALSTASPAGRIWAATNLTGLFQDVSARVAKPDHVGDNDLSAEMKALDAGAAKLIPLLSDPTPGVRNAGVAAVVASSLPADQILDPLLQLFGDSVQGPRLSAIRLIGQLGPPAAKAATNLGALVGDKTPFAAPLAAGSLSQLGSAGVEPLVASYDQIKAPKIKVAVLHAMAQLRRGVPEAGLREEGIVEASTQDADKSVSYAGLQLALTNFDPKFRFPVRRIQGESSATPDSAGAPAQLASVTTPLPKTDEALLRALQSTTPAERLLVSQSMSALSVQARNDAMPLIKSYLHSKVPADQVVGMNAFKSLGPEAKPLVMDLLTLLDADNNQVAMVALKTLGEMGPTAADALPALKQRLNDPQSLNENLKIIIPSVITKIEGSGNE